MLNFIKNIINRVFDILIRYAKHPIKIWWHSIYSKIYLIIQTMKNHKQIFFTRFRDSLNFEGNENHWKISLKNQICPFPPNFQPKTSHRIWIFFPQKCNPSLQSRKGRLKNMLKMYVSLNMFLIKTKKINKSNYAALTISIWLFMWFFAVST